MICCNCRFFINAFMTATQHDCVIVCLLACMRAVDGLFIFVDICDQAEQLAVCVSKTCLHVCYVCVDGLHVLLIAGIIDGGLPALYSCHITILYGS